MERKAKLSRRLKQFRQISVTDSGPRCAVRKYDLLTWLPSTACWKALTCACVRASDYYYPVKFTVGTGRVSQWIDVVEVDTLLTLVPCRLVDTRLADSVAERVVIAT